MQFHVQSENRGLGYSLTAIVVGTFAFWQVAVPPGNLVAAYEVSRGRQIIVNQGIQLPAFGAFNTDDCPVNVSQLLTAHYTMIDVYVDPRVLTLPGMETMRFGSCHAAQDVSRTFYPTYADRLIAINFQDEPGPYTNPADQPLLNRLSEFGNAYNNWRSRFPNALCYLNTAGLREYTSDPSGTGGTEAGLRAYIEGSRPDMLMFDYYPSYTFPSSERNTWYSTMAVFRRQALMGIDGSSTKPIVYGQYMNMYRTSQDGPKPTESFVRMQRFASLAFGFQFLEDFVYKNDAPWFNGGNIYGAMFDGAGDSQPNDVFLSVSKANREICNLSPALSRLVSTDIQMIRGSAYTSRPGDIARWGRSDSNSSSLKWQNSHTADTDDCTDYITSLTPYTDSTANGGTIDTTYGDILIGYLNPLLPDNSGCAFTDGLHFMIVNGTAGNTAEASAQWYHLTFDFSNSHFDSLVRLSRDTGKVEVVSLTHAGGANYYLDLNLPGGTGDLFAFWDSSNPLPTIPEPQSLTLLMIGLFAASGYFRSRR